MCIAKVKRLQMRRKQGELTKELQTQKLRRGGPGRLEEQGAERVTFSDKEFWSGIWQVEGAYNCSHEAIKLERHGKD